MKWLDPTWWKGISKPIVLAPPEQEGGAWRFLILQKDQDKVHVKASGELPTEEAVRDFLKKNNKAPILLCLWGPWVFERALEAEYLDDPVTGIMGVSIDSQEEFATSLFLAAGDKVWAAIIRREKIAETAAMLGDHAPRIVQVAISKASWAAWLPTLLPEAGYLRLQLAGEPMCFKEGLPCSPEDLNGRDFREVNPADFAETAGLAPEYLDLYVAALSLWLKPEQSAEPMGETFTAFTKAATLKQIAAVWAVVLAVWAVVLLSLRIQGERRKAELEYTYSLNLPVISSLNQLDEKIADRRALRTQLGGSTLAPTRTSFYLDRIAVLCPAQVRLSQLTCNPEAEQLKRAGAPDMDQYQIILRGESHESRHVADFSKTLERQAWVKDIKVLDSKVNFQTGAYDFTFLIQHDV